MSPGFPSRKAGKRKPEESRLPLPTRLFSWSPAFLLYPNGRLDRRRDRVRLPIDLSALAPFDQEPDLRLRARITQEDAAIAVQFLFRGADQFHHLRQRFQ